MVKRAHEPGSGVVRGAAATKQKAGADRPSIQSLRFKIQDSKVETRNLNWQIQNARFQTGNSQWHIQNSRFKTSTAN
jgi:hypothetical protein